MCVPPSQRNPVGTSFHCPYSRDGRHIPEVTVHTPTDHHQQPNVLESDCTAEKVLPYTYKFLRDVNFADDSNLGFLQFYFRGSLFIRPCVSSVLQCL